MPSFPFLPKIVKNPKAMVGRQSMYARRELGKNFRGSEFKLRGSEKIFGGSENKLGAFLFERSGLRCKNPIRKEGEKDR